VERTLEIRTGESVAIRYELAGLGSRFLAVGLDMMIQLAVTAVVFGVLLALSKPLGAALANAPPTLAKSGGAIYLALGVVAAFGLYFGYFIVFELWWSGRTPGKRVLGIRVIRDAGFPIDLGAATIRNVVRILEFGLGLYAVAAICALLSPQNKRLGDYAAGTIVVRDGSHSAADIDAYLAREPASDDGLAPAERALIERYVLRRAQLTAAARTSLAAQIAVRVRPQLRASFDHLDDDALLVHLGRNVGR
jgi:uncharacterized RDD family membrane protein YckC